ncbi:hypothetical protein C1646_762967 [Rhizophagus diaphanus]|nr:hypothetical protein C1646_762967 [Rhizophagus diaphanus] [Rhizophagus sp. MUCL 43196]
MQLYLPTVDIQQRNYLKLYSLNTLPYTQCQLLSDDNEHIDLCRIHRDFCHNLLIKYKHILYDTIKDINDAPLPSLMEIIDNSPMFSANLNTTLSKNHPLYFCGMCGIIQNGDQGKYSRFNGRIWFANNSAILLGYCGLSTSRTMFNSPFSSKNSYSSVCQKRSIIAQLVQTLEENGKFEIF